MSQRNTHFGTERTRESIYGLLTDHSEPLPAPPPFGNVPLNIVIVGESAKALLIARMGEETVGKPRVGASVWVPKSQVGNPSDNVHAGRVLYKGKGWLNTFTLSVPAWLYAKIREQL